MKSAIFLFLSLLITPLWGEDPIGKYKYFTTWEGFTGSGSPGPKGTYQVDLTISKKEGTFQIDFEKSIDPPGNVLSFVANTKSLSEFSFTDTWEDSGKGSILFQDNGLITIVIELTDPNNKSMLRNLYDEDLLLKLDDHTEKNYNSEGEKLYSDKKYKAAAEIFSVLSDTYPSNERAAGNYIISLIKLEKFDKALKLAQNLLISTNDKTIKGSTLYNIGLINEKKGNIGEALKSYERSVEFRPNNYVNKKIEELKNR